MKKTNRLIAGVVATAIAAGFSVAAEAQPEYQVMPAEQHANEWRSLSTRVERALLRYGARHDAATRDDLFAPLAVIEYPSQTFGGFDSFSAADLERSWPAFERARVLRLYPTGSKNITFVEYTVAGRERPGVAFIEMRGNQIARIRDFSSPDLDVATTVAREP